MNTSNSINYGLSSEEAESFKKRADEVSYQIERGEIQPGDLAQIGRLLEVNASNFGHFSKKPWFSKAWLLVTGRRGKIIDQSVSNLGKVQVGVLKVLDEILRNNIEVKEDILQIFDTIDIIQNDIHELKYFILEFDKRNKERYRKLRRELGHTRTSVRFSMTLIGIALLCLVAVFALPTLDGYQAEIGFGIAGMTGFLLLSRAAYSYWTEKSNTPLKVKAPNTVSTDRLPKDESFERTESFLGIDRDEGRVFKLKTEVDQVVDYFALSDAEKCLLFSIQHYLVTSDARGNQQKERWLRKWTLSVQRSVEGRVVVDAHTLERGLEELRYASIPRIKLETIMLQAYLFEPYYPLSEDGNSFAEEYDETSHKRGSRQVAHSIGLDFESIELARNRYEDAYENIPPSSSIVGYVFNAAATALGAIVGAGALFIAGRAMGNTMGLSGPEAISSGLALFSGGIITGESPELSKLDVAWIGGGAVLGGGSTMALMLGTNKSFMLRELAELEAATKTFLIHLPEPEDAIDTVISNVRDDRKMLERKVKSSSGEEAKQAEVSAEYCERFLQRIQDFKSAEPWRNNSRNLSDT